MAQIGIAAVLLGILCMTVTMLMAEYAKAHYMKDWMVAVTIAVWSLGVFAIVIAMKEFNW